MKRVLIFSSMLLFATAAFGFAPTEHPTNLSLRDTHGAKAKLSDYRGKVVVLNFWATWCGPCNVEMPLLVKASTDYAGKNIVFLGVSVDSHETQNKIDPFVQKLGITYPVWEGATDIDMTHLGMGNAVPGTAFIDTDGVIRMRILGQMRPGEIEERLDWLLGDRKSPMPPPLVQHLEEK